jgi:hypothetical protein
MELVKSIRSGGKSRHKIRRFGDWIFGRRPGVYAFLYLLLIPVAGIAFSFLPARSFYDANLTRESGFQGDLDKLTNQLTQSIEDQESGDYVGHKIPEPSWNFSGHTLSIDPVLVFVQPGSITVGSSGDLNFNIEGLAYSGPAKDPSIEEQFVVPVTLSASEQGAETLPFADGYTLATYPVTSTAVGLASNRPGLDILLPEARTLNPDASIIKMDPSVALRLDQLSTAGRGDPKYASGLYVRMFYFSAVTITTLGYGDITPVTSTARLLVSMEAIAGVVLVGFFLNAVARRLSNN